MSTAHRPASPSLPPVRDSARPWSCTRSWRRSKRSSAATPRRESAEMRGDPPTSGPDPAGGPDVIDLRWMGRANCIAAWRADEVLVDCGPSTTVDTLVDALGERRPRALLLTHIHFDHAGGAGVLVRRWPDLEVWVHRRGARHLAALERLEASARRVFGESFDERFGPLTPIPERNLHPLDGGESVHGFDVLETPGHANHHVAYLDEAGGRAFVGDVAAARLIERGPVPSDAAPGHRRRAMASLPAAADRAGPELARPAALRLRPRSRTAPRGCGGGRSPARRTRYVARSRRLRKHRARRTVRRARAECRGSVRTDGTARPEPPRPAPLGRAARLSSAAVRLRRYGPRRRSRRSRGPSCARGGRGRPFASSEVGARTRRA